MTKWNPLSGEEKRKIRKNEIFEIIIKTTNKGKAVIEKKFIAQLSFKWGLKPKTIGEYIDELADADLIKREKNEDKDTVLISTNGRKKTI